MAKVSASLLACDQTKLGQNILLADKCCVDLYHIDVMDGHYVANLAYGPQTVRDIRKISKTILSVHLEVNDPDNVVPLFYDTGADIITFQLDSCANPIHLLEDIRKHNIKAGIGIGPAYNVEQIELIIDHIDYLILMSVEPGYGGQKFEASVFEKIKKAKEIMNKHHKDIPIAIDGGMNPTTGKQVLDLGADILISGSWLFKDNLEDNIAKLKQL